MISILLSLRKQGRMIRTALLTCLLAVGLASCDATPLQPQPDSMLRGVRKNPKCYSPNNLPAAVQGQKSLYSDIEALILSLTQDANIPARSSKTYDPAARGSQLQPEDIDAIINNYLAGRYPLTQRKSTYQELQNQLSGMPQLPSPYYGPAVQRPTSQQIDINAIVNAPLPGQYPPPQPQPTPTYQEDNTDSELSILMGMLMDKVNNELQANFRETEPLGVTDVAWAWKSFLLRSLARPQLVIPPSAGAIENSAALPPGYASGSQKNVAAESTLPTPAETTTVVDSDTTAAKGSGEKVTKVTDEKETKATDATEAKSTVAKVTKGAY